MPTQHKIYSVEEILLDDDIFSFLGERDSKAAQAWVSQNPKSTSNLQESQTLFRLLNGNQVPLSEARAEFLSRIAPTQKETPVKKLNSLFGVPMARVAASIALVVCSLGGYWLWQSVGYIDEYTSANETKTIALPDSSLVIMRPNSHIRCPKSWSFSSTRTIEFEGEGYFDVNRMPSSPFRIESDADFDAEVLGTSFQYLKRPAVSRVILEEGAINVLLKESTKAIQIKPGQLFEIKNGVLDIKTVDIEALSAWKKNYIVFRNASVSEVLHSFDLLYRIDGAKVEAPSVIAPDKTFTGIVPIATPEQMLNELAKTFDWEVSKKDSAFVLKNK